MEEREAIRILVGFDRRLVHQAANGKVGHHEPVEFLANQIGCLAAQDDPGAAQVGLEFVERRLDFPALMVEGGQLCRRGRRVIQDGGDQPIDRLGTGDAIETIVDDAHLDASGLVAPDLSRMGRCG